MILEAEFSEQAEVLHADFGGVPEISYPVVASISIEKMYAISASDTDAPSDWETVAPTPTYDNPYLWQKTITSGTTEEGTHFRYEDKGVVVGVSGKDGISPVVSVSAITGGNRITITDATGTKTVDVLNGKDGMDSSGGTGKSAYEYAQEGGYTGTEEEFAQKLASESSYIHIGTEAPTDPNVNAWIDTDEEVPSGGGGVSSWNDLTDRPFYSEYEISTVLNETSPAFNEEEGAFDITDPISLTTGNEYTVNWNGTEYTCVCGETDIDGALFQYLGNAAPMGMGDDTGEPFFMLILPAEMAAEVGVYAQILPIDGSTELTISITGIEETVTPIPEKYLPGGCILYAGEANLAYKSEDTSNPENRLTIAEVKQTLASGRTFYNFVTFVNESSGNTSNRFVPARFIEKGEGGYSIEFDRDVNNPGDYVTRLFVI